jgi:hypothetical protein
MPQNFVAIQSISYNILTQPMQLNATIMETEMLSALKNVPQTTFIFHNH